MTPDICSIVVILTMNAVGCVSSNPVCKPSADGTRQLCSMAFCAPPPPTYNCKREDGSTYVWQDINREGER